MTEEYYTYEGNSISMTDYFEQFAKKTTHNTKDRSAKNEVKKEVNAPAAAR